MNGNIWSKTRSPLLPGLPGIFYLTSWSPRYILLYFLVSQVYFILLPGLPCILYLTSWSSRYILYLTFWSPRYTLPCFLVFQVYFTLLPGISGIPCLTFWSLSNILTYFLVSPVYFTSLSVLLSILYLTSWSPKFWYTSPYNLVSRCILAFFLFSQISVLPYLLLNQVKLFFLTIIIFEFYKFTKILGQNI